LFTESFDIDVRTFTTVQHAATHCRSHYRCLA